MPDELLERRLREALRSAGDGLALTITAPELEQRWIARRRRSRTAGLLLAAAVGIGLFGVTGVAGGWLDGVRLPVIGPAPSDSAVRPSAAPSSLDARTRLPDLADLMADHAPDRVVLAQANGPALGSTVPPDSSFVHSPIVDLGPLPAPADYELTIACLSEGFVGLAFGSPDRQPLQDGRAVCNGAVWTETVHAATPPSLQFVVGAQASWRIVVRRTDSATAPAAGEPAVPAPGRGEETLIRADSRGLQRSPSPGAVAPRLFAGGLVQREAYRVRMSCAGGPFVEYLVGDDSGGGVSVLTETFVACDGAMRQDLFAITEPAGAKMYVAAAPGARWHLLVTGLPLPTEVPESS